MTTIKLSQADIDVMTLDERTQYATQVLAQTAAEFWSGITRVEYFWNGREPRNSAKGRFCKEGLGHYVIRYNSSGEPVDALFMLNRKEAEEFVAHALANRNVTTTPNPHD